MAIQKQRSLNILSCNANGLINKHNELEVLAQQENIDVILVQETKLNNRNPPKLGGYIAISKPNHTHHGLAMYIKSELQFHELSINTTDCENQIIIINNTAIINFYKFNDKNINYAELDSLINIKNKVIIAGDFNARHSNWNNYQCNSDGNKLQTYINQSNIDIHYPQNSFTHYPYNINNRPSTIDLVLAKNNYIN